MPGFVRERATGAGARAGFGRALERIRRRSALGRSVVVGGAAAALDGPV